MDARFFIFYVFSSFIQKKPYASPFYTFNCEEYNNIQYCTSAGSHQLHVFQKQAQPTTTGSFLFVTSAKCTIVLFQKRIKKI